MSTIENYYYGNYGAVNGKCAIMFTPCFTSSKIDPGSCSYPHCDPKRTLAWPNIKDWSYFPTPQFGTPQCLTDLGLAGFARATRPPGARTPPLMLILTTA